MSLVGARALIVEDDGALRDALERVFSLEGVSVRTAAEGHHALKLLQEETPDLILLDLMLPWVNGIQVLAAVRQNPRLVSVPVIVTTGTATSAFDLRGFGPLYVVHKPLDMDVLVQVAGKLLAKLHE